MHQRRLHVHRLVQVTINDGSQSCSCETAVKAVKETAVKAVKVISDHWQAHLHTVYMHSHLQAGFNTPTGAAAAPDCRFIRAVAQK